MIHKAIIPAAGFGTRFLPATKALPKEMIPVVDTPTIEYVVREAVESGIDDILIVVSRGKRAIEEHFSRNFELESALEMKNKRVELDLIRAFDDIHLHFVWQHEQNGLGDAVLHGKNHVGDEPFAVLLGDTVMESYSDRPVTGQIIDVFERYGSSVIALQEVPAELVSRYGIVGGNTESGDVIEIDRLVEKPSPADAPSRLAIASRYVLSPAVFDILEDVKPESGGEIGLTEAIQQLLAREKVYGRRIEGKRHDIGNKLEFIKANVLLGLKREDIGSELAAWLDALRENR